MRAAIKNPPIVQAGEVRTIIATGIIAIDRGDGYVQVTFCHDQMWGSKDVIEREVAGRVVMTPHCWDEFKRAAEALGVHIELQVAPSVH
jgi:hypothetical protein